MRYTFWAAGDPIPQGSFRHIGNGRIISANPKLNAWRETIAETARTLDKPVLDVPVMVHLHFYLTRPKSVKRGLPSKKNDLDKLVRAALDAISLDRFHKLLQDDGLVCYLSAQKSYSETPGVEITIEII
jgi:Holliday junction resolvase RusA-like endonuclease